MIWKYLIVPAFLLLFLNGCQEEETATLPETVTIEIKEKSITNATVLLSATKAGHGIAGDWSFVSDNASTGSFSNEQDPLAAFTGDPFETYTLKWTLTKIEDTEKSAEISFRIADGYSVNELLAANIPISKISDVVLVEDLKAAGVSENELRSDGIIGEDEDNEGNVYPWVKIGKDRWMAKNLQSTKFADGTPIANDALKWWINPYNNDPAYIETYGLMYNWIAARRDTPRERKEGIQGVCPADWHIPSEKEWNDLKTLLGPDDGVPIKTTGTIEGATGLWGDSGNPSHHGTNKSGFSALPGGEGDYEPELATLTFRHLGEMAIFWSTGSYEISTTDNAFAYAVFHDKTQIFLWPTSGGSHGSVRCVKD